MRRLLTALVVPSLLLVAACGDDGGAGDDEGATTEAGGGELEECARSDALDAIAVTGEPGEKPVLEFEQPFSVEQTTCKVLVEGDGDALEDGDTAIFDFLFVNARDGSELGSSYEGTGPAEVIFDDQLLRGVRLALGGLTAGSRAIAAIAPEDGFGDQGDDPATGMRADDTVLFVVELHDVRRPLAQAEGEAVEPPEGLPTVELDDDGTPSAITVPDTDSPAELVDQVLVQGEGPAVEAGQTITVHYTGVLWDGGEQFDSSWGGSPASFSIGTGGVIAGWDKGLVGKAVGSRVLLVIPPEDGYPDGTGPIPPGATLVFVVDILDAHDPR